MRDNEPTIIIGARIDNPLTTSKLINCETALAAPRSEYLLLELIPAKSGPYILVAPTLNTNSSPTLISAIIGLITSPNKVNSGKMAQEPLQ